MDFAGSMRTGRYLAPKKNTPSASPIPEILWS
jgi:hypothetical protein